MRAVAYMVLATALMSLMAALISLAGREMPAIQVTFLRSLFGLAFALPFLLRTGLSGLRTDRSLLHAGRALISVLGLLAWVNALTLLPLGEAVALNFSAPLFTSVMAAVFLRERVGANRWSAVLVGFLGVLVILRPGAGVASMGAPLALVAALVLAMNILLIRKMQRAESGVVITAWFAFYLTAFTAPPAFWFWQTISPSAWLTVIALGAVATGAHLSLAKALALAEASLLAPLDFLRLIFAGVLGYFLFAQTPDVWTVAGSIIVAGSAIYVTRREARKAAAERSPTKAAYLTVSGDVALSDPGADLASRPKR